MIERKCDCTFFGLSCKYGVHHTLFKMKILVLKVIIPLDSVGEYRTTGCHTPENRALGVQILLISVVD